MLNLKEFEPSECTNDKHKNNYLNFFTKIDLSTQKLCTRKLRNKTYYDLEILFKMHVK